MQRLVRTISALIASAALVVVPIGGLAVMADAATGVATCTWSDLSLSLGVTLGGGGSMGTPIKIKNHGSSACSITGYPRVVGYTVAKSPHPITFVDKIVSQMYAAPAPKLVVIAPKGTASFGISYLDVLGQRYKNEKGCQMNRIAVMLPGVRPVATPSGVTLSLANVGGLYHYINACFTNFKFGLTPVVNGPNPPAQGAA